jgi:hypothetical protein
MLPRCFSTPLVGMDEASDPNLGSGPACAGSRPSIVITRLIFVLFVFVGGWCRTADAQEVSADIQTIRDAWETQAAEIRTARVIMRKINRLGTVPTNWAGVQAAFNELAAVEATGDRDAIRLAVMKSVESLGGPTESPEWPEMTILVDGPAVRNIIKVEGKVVSELNFKDGASVRYFPNFKAATIEAGASQEARFGIHFVRPILGPKAEWRLTPSNSSDVISLECVEKLPEPEGEIVARALVDRRTMILKRSELPELDARIRGALAEFPGGVVVPTFGIDVSMGGTPRVRTIKAFIVEHAQFNLRLDEADLSVAVPERTRIVDKRAPGSNKVGMSDSAGDPMVLAEQIRMRRNQSPQKAAPAESSGFLLLLGLNILILVIVALIFLVRRRKPS